MTMQDPAQKTLIDMTLQYTGRAYRLSNFVFVYSFDFISSGLVQSPTVTTRSEIVDREDNNTIATSKRCDKG
jgi:hypothetical protein